MVIRFGIHGVCASKFVSRGVGALFWEFWFRKQKGSSKFRTFGRSPCLDGPKP